MSKSNEIRELIATLSQTEKRYFRVFSKLSGTKDTVTQQLFDNIDKTHAGAKNDFETSNLSRDMGYLEKQLLRSLRNYHDESSAEIILNQLLCETELLYNKRLYAKCLKWIAGGMRLAEDESLISHSLLLLKWKQRCHLQKQQNTLAREVNRQEEQLLLVQQNSFNVKKLFHQLFDISLQDGTQSDRMRKAAKEVSTHPVLSLPDIELTFDARLMRLNILQFTEIAFNGYTAHLVQLAKRYAAFFDSKRISKRPNQYFSALARLSSSHINAGDTAGFERTLVKMEDLLKLKNLPGRLRIDIPTEIMSQRIQAYAEKVNKDDREGIKISEQYASFIEKNSDTIRPSSLATYYHFSAVSYYYGGEPKQARKFIARLEELVSQNFMLELFIGGRLLEMMMLVDEDYFITLPHKIQSLERAIKQLKYRNTALAFFTRFLKSVPGMLKPERKKQAAALLEKLNATPKQEIYMATDMVNVRRWLAGMK